MPWVTRRWPRETSRGRFAHTMSASPRPREERPSILSAATPQSIASSRSSSRNHFLFPKTIARTTGQSHRTQTVGKVLSGKAMGTVSRRRVGSRATVEAAARRRRQREIETIGPPVGAGWEARAVGGLPLPVREETRRTTGSTPRSSTFGTPRPGVSPMKILRYPPTMTVRIGKILKRRHRLPGVSNRRST